MASARSTFLILAALLVSIAGIARGNIVELKNGGTWDFNSCTGCKFPDGVQALSVPNRACKASIDANGFGVCKGACPLTNCNPDCGFSQVNPSTLSCACVGGVCGDPHFYNQGVTFDFHGLPDHEYALVSDQDFALNAHMVGQDVTATGETGTWMSRLGFVYNMEGQTHKVTLALEDSEDQSTTTNVVTVTVDGTEVALFNDYTQAGIGLSISLDNEGAYVVDIKDHVSARIVISEHTAPDGFNFDISLFTLQVSSNVHGVLGQTYQAERAATLQAMADSSVGTSRSYTDSDILDGAEGDYEVSGLTETDFKYNRFVSPNGAIVMSARKLLFVEQGAKTNLPFRVSMNGNSMRFH